jgi:hypothetical protein
MDISTLVKYEQLFELDIVDPKTEKPVGIKMMIRSSESPAAKEVLRDHLDKNIETRAKGKLVQSGALIRQELESTAACIASWEWGENVWKNEVPQLSMKKAIEVLDEAPWIYAQVRGASGKVANFMEGSAKGSADE